jgi:hypothetical protein
MVEDDPSMAGVMQHHRIEEQFRQRADLDILGRFQFEQPQRAVATEAQ